MDPMTTTEAAYEESVIKADEARVEQHFAEIQQVLSDVLAVRKQCYSRRGNLAYALDIIEAVRYGDTQGFTLDHIRALQAFDADYGTPALLTALARVFEADRGGA